MSPFPDGEPLELILGFLHMLNHTLTSSLLIFILVLIVCASLPPLQITTLKSLWWVFVLNSLNPFCGGLSWCDYWCLYLKCTDCPLPCMRWDVCKGFGHIYCAGKDNNIHSTFTDMYKILAIAYKSEAALSLKGSRRRHLRLKNALMIFWSQSVALNLICNIDVLDYESF